MSDFWRWVIVAVLVVAAVYTWNQLYLACTKEVRDRHEARIKKP